MADIQPSGGPKIEILDEGVSQGRVKKIDFVGGGVTATVSTDTGTVTVSGGITSDELVKVSSNDTTGGYLNGKLVIGIYTTLTENNDGGNETLTVDVNVSALEAAVTHGNLAGLTEDDHTQYMHYTVTDNSRNRIRSQAPAGVPMMLIADPAQTARLFQVTDTNLVPKVVIDKDYQLGVNVATPTAQLDVLGTVYIEGNEPNEPVLYIVGSASQVKPIFAIDDNLGNPLFTVGKDGDMEEIKGVPYDWPASNSSGILTNDGAGNLTWVALPASRPTGTANQIPYMDGAGTDFTYSANFTFDGNDLRIQGDNDKIYIGAGDDISLYWDGTGFKIDGIPTATVDATDKVLIEDTDDSDRVKTVTVQSIVDLAGGFTQQEILHSIVTHQDEGNVVLDGELEMGYSAVVIDNNGNVVYSEIV